MADVKEAAAKALTGNEGGVGRVGTGNNVGDIPGEVSGPEVPFGRCRSPVPKIALGP